MISSFLEKTNYIPGMTDFKYQKAVLYSLLIPAMIISLNEGFYHATLLAIICWLIGHKNIRPFMDFKQYSLKETLKITGRLYLVSLGFSVLTLKIMGFWGVNDPQGIRDTIFTNQEFINGMLTLPFVAIGEEFFKLLVFIAFIVLLPQSSRSVKIFIATLIASFVFGYLHVFSYDRLTAGLPLMMGAIPTFYFMLYYRSILPLIIEHFFFDLLSYILHTQYQDIFLAILTTVFIIVWIWYMLKSILKKDKPRPRRKYNTFVRKKPPY